MQPPDNIPQLWREPVAGFDPWANAPDGAWFDVDAAEACCEFFPNNLRLQQGEFAGQPFVLERWQKQLVGYLFGWKMADGFRRFNELFLYIPRKNGKTTLGAGLLLLLFTSDGELAAQIYCAAADTDQAGIAFGEAESMVIQNEDMNAAIKILPSYRTMRYGRSVLRVLSSVAESKHGLNLHGYLVDELHAQKDNRLVEALETGTASRRQPMGMCLTTADHAGDTICNEKLEYARKVRDGILDQPHLLPIIYESAQDADWRDLEVWKAANPNYGTSLRPEYAVKMIAKATAEPSFLPSLKRLHLNIQTNLKSMWLPMSSWKACGGPLDDEAMRGADECYGGLDLASTSDITALALYWPENHECLLRFYIPEARLEGGVNSEHYRRWCDAGHMTATPGDITDYEFVKADVLELSGKYPVADIGFDRWNSSQIVNDLVEADGVEMVEFGQGYKDMSCPAKELERLVISRTLRHGDNPVLYWMASNCAIQADPANNIKPVKPKRTDSVKIDGIVALTMAIGRAMQSDPDSYAEQGKLVVI